MSTPPANFQTIAIVGKHGDPRVGDSLLALVEHLISRGRRVFAAPDLDLPFAAGSVERIPELQFAARAELIVAIGGDGTMLYAARLAAENSVPLLGINRGRLGFLTDISPGEMCDRVDDVLAG